ncbi:MAG: flavodoxin family protein [Syntrophomonadaceae bacterium]|nr:flavodoxin family protein [Syntrophomonadaceae bacterium]MDD3270673.1 flavodoxin family protein [Syntrophomonadaceae bacterium]MDD3897770.1 flavodoxin family protein [Syntrophomonadaceae bacterium]MDD4561649.1 flavodoxin family protein [Syntrophomonadaceae bacterium]
MPKLLIVAINGSPNSEGNTSFLLQQALDECATQGADTEVLYCREIFKDQRNPFCVACSSPCTGKCYKNKELANAYELISRADGLILGSPVYFGTVSAQLKTFFDKSRALRTEKKLLNVVGGAITCGASRFGGQETTIRAMHDIMLVHGMIIVGDGYGEDDCGHMGAAAQRPAEEDDNAIQRSRIMGKRIFEVARATTRLRKR